MKCVKEHKIEYDCDGLKGIPTAPVAGDGAEKYTEALFMKDYNFLENVSTYAGALEREREREQTTMNKMEQVSESRKKKILEFKRIQKVGKLAELRLLPCEFSRSRKNRTHLVMAESKESERDDVPDDEDMIPEQKSSRKGKISWTVDFVDHDTDTLIETKFDIDDSTPLRDLIPANVKTVYLKNETRVKGTGKWKEVEGERTLAQVLVGARVFEYPILALIYMK